MTPDQYRITEQIFPVLVQVSQPPRGLHHNDQALAFFNPALWSAALK